MEIILIPVGETITEEEVILKCAAYDCKAKRIKKTNEYLIMAKNPVNFFWLGMNWNNGLLNHLIQNQK